MMIKIPRWKCPWCLSNIGYLGWIMNMIFPKLHYCERKKEYYESKDHIDGKDQ